MAKSKQIMIDNSRCAWPHLFVAEEYMGNRKYSIQLDLDEVNQTKVEDALYAAIEAQFPGKSQKLAAKFKQSKTTWPIRQDEDGRVFITPKRREEKGAPMVIDQRKQNLAADSGKPYSGCIVNALIEAYCYTQNGGGVTLYLDGVQFVKDGPRAGGALTATDIVSKFGDISDTGEAEQDPPFEAEDYGI